MRKDTRPEHLTWKDSPYVQKLKKAKFVRVSEVRTFEVEE
jgi:hypothetical protein